jgi:hypothetical protein
MHIQSSNKEDDEDSIEFQPIKINEAEKIMEESDSAVF